MSLPHQINSVALDERPVSPQGQILFSFDATAFMESEPVIPPLQIDSADFDAVSDLLSASSPYSDNPLPSLDLENISMDFSDMQAGTLEVDTPKSTTLSARIILQTRAEAEQKGATDAVPAHEMVASEKLEEKNLTLESCDTAWIQCEPLPMGEASPSHFKAQPLSARSQLASSPFSQVSRGRPGTQSRKTPGKSVKSPKIAKARRTPRTGRQHIEHLNLAIADEVSPGRGTSLKKGLALARSLTNVTNAQQQQQPGICVQSAPLFDASRHQLGKAYSTWADFGNHKSPQAAASSSGPSLRVCKATAGITPPPVAPGSGMRVHSQDLRQHHAVLKPSGRPAESNLGLHVSPDGRGFVSPTTRAHIMLKQSPAVAASARQDSPPDASHLGKAVSPCALPMNSGNMEETGVHTAGGRMIAGSFVPGLALSGMGSSSSRKSKGSFASPVECETAGSLSGSGNRSKMRYSEGADPSNYCHICGRAKRSITLNICANTRVGLCRKTVCDKCLLVYQLKWYNWAKEPNSTWTCCHCQNECPPRARCHSYKRNNQKRRARKEQEKSEQGKENGGGRSGNGAVKVICKGESLGTGSSARGKAGRREGKRTAKSKPPEESEQVQDAPPPDRQEVGAQGVGEIAEVEVFPPGAQEGAEGISALDEALALFPSFERAETPMGPELPSSCIELDGEFQFNGLTE